MKRGSATAATANSGEPAWIRAMAQGVLPGWVQWAFLLLGATLVLRALPGYLTRAGDFQLYLELGRTVLAGGHIYRDLPPGGATWPPFFALWCVPLALGARLGPVAVRIGWFALNAFLLWFILRALVRLVHGRDLAVRPAAGTLGLTSPTVLIPLVLTWAFLDANFGYLQVNLVVLACEVAALAWLADGQDGAGGAAIGFAASLKVLPGLLIVYLAWRRRYRAAAAALGAGAACSLAPILVFGRSRYWAFVRDWPRAVSCGWGVNGPNQSLYALADRFLGHGLRPWNAGGVPLTFLADSGDARAAVAWLFLVAGVLGGLAIGLPRGGNWTRRSVVLEGGCVITASILVSPLAWLHYFVVLLVPLVVLAARLRETRDPAVRAVLAWALAAAVVLILPSSVDLAGRWGAATWLNDGSVTVAALVILGTGLWLRGRPDQRIGTAG